MTFSFGLTGSKQRKTKEIFSFITKTKQITLSFGLAGTKQMRTNGILPFSSSKVKQHITHT